MYLFVEHEEFKKCSPGTWHTTTFNHSNTYLNEFFLGFRGIISTYSIPSSSNLKTQKPRRKPTWLAPPFRFPSAIEPKIGKVESQKRFIPLQHPIKLGLSCISVFVQVVISWFGRAGWNQETEGEEEQHYFTHACSLRPENGLYTARSGTVPSASPICRLLWHSSSSLTPSFHPLFLRPCPLPYSTLTSLHPALLLLQPLLRRPLRVLLSLPFLFSSSVVAWLWEERAYRATLCHQTACSLFSWSGRFRVNADIIYGFLSECIPAFPVSRNATDVSFEFVANADRRGTLVRSFKVSRVFWRYGSFSREIYSRRITIDTRS